ncbi:MAG: radical SAM protein [Dehalococcoidales bacterium]|nr:radical SAM protein [Dehalococcoidales bacterium]
MLPSYLALYNSGELRRRAGRLEARLSSCDLCPHACRVNRLEGEEGFCHSGLLPAVSSYCAHKGEEPALSGSRGSGTIFFGKCNMRCVYCQNYQISQDYEGQKASETDCHALARIMLHLQDELKCHNINLVSPSHYVPQIVNALLEAVPLGLRLPLVYNTGGYDSLETLRELEGIVDIYLPDLRYASAENGMRYSLVPDYPVYNRAAIREMYRQTGDLVLDENEIACRGVIVRHLILPGRLAGTRDSLTWLANDISRDVTISLMSQYYPCHKAGGIRELSRTITYAEYSEAAGLLEELGLENGWLQEMDAPANYLPDFKREGHPFSAEEGGSGS